MTDVFISYKHRMMPRVRQIAEALTDLGLDVWYDAGLISGSDYADAISQQLRAAKCVLVCWSNDAFPHGGDKNGWVRGEAEKGRDRSALVAVMLEPADLDPPWNTVHYEKLHDWTPESSDRAAWQRVLKAIGSLVGRPGLGDYDEAVMAGTSASLSDWARSYSGDRLAPAAKARAKELYLAEAAAKFEADDVEQAAAAAQAAKEKAEKDSTAAELDRLRRVQEAARVRAADEKRARDDVAEASEARAKPDEAPRVASPPEPAPSPPQPPTGQVTRREVLLYGLAGLVLCDLVFAIAIPSGWLVSMMPGVLICGVAIGLYGAAIALLFWRRKVLRDWRAIALALAFPVAAVAAGWLTGTIGQSIYALSDSSTIFAIGGGLIGAALMFAVLFGLRALPSTGRNLGIALATIVACSAITGIVSALLGVEFSPEIFAWLSISWQATFTVGLALMLAQAGRSAKTI